MSYSRELKALDVQDVEKALRQLLNQLNRVQQETEQQLDRLAARVAELEAAKEGRSI